MSPILVDARGKTCPVPLVMTKQAYDRLAPDENLTVLVDNDTSAGNIERFIGDSGGEVKHEKDGALWRLSIRRGQDETREAETYCSPAPAARAHTIYISTDRIGLGDDDLGPALMQTFLATIKDVTPLPSHLIFMHRGVLLLEQGRKTAEFVAALEALGVVALACGTCVDWFGLGGRLGAGRVSNMFEILGVFTRAAHVVRP